MNSLQRQFAIFSKQSSGVLVRIYVTLQKNTKLPNNASETDIKSAYARSLEEREKMESHETIHKEESNQNDSENGEYPTVAGFTVRTVRIKVI